jgi:hypothetical protein
LRTSLTDGVQAFAQRCFERFIRFEGRFGGVAQHVELADLVGHRRPELLDGQQFTCLRIADRAEHFHS